MKLRVSGFAFLLLLPFLLSADYYHFTHLTMEDGLSSNAVYCMIQDSRGYMWFGTFSGLTRYDGRSTTIFRPQAGNPRSISGSVIFSLLEDSRGNLWVGTDGGGLNLFNRDSLTFDHYTNDPDDPKSLPSNQVFALAEDKIGRLWIGTAGGGLCFYRGDGRFFVLNEGNSSLVHDRIRALHTDDEGLLWIGTEKGLSLYDPSSGRFLPEEERPGMALLKDRFIRSLVADEKGRLWIGTGQGLFVHDPADRRIRLFPLPFQSSVRSITLDRDRLWIGTERSGILLYNFAESRWETIEATGNPGELSHGKIRGLYRDRNGLIWIGTRGGGVNLFNPATALIQTFRSDPSSSNSLRNSDIRQMIERRDGTVWIASDGGGISILDRESGRFSSLRVQPTEPETDSDQVYSLMEDHQDNLWIGTDGSGLYFLPAGKGVEHIRRIPLKEASDPRRFKETIWAILEDYEHTVWIGTEGDGLFAIKDGVMTRYKHEPDNHRSLNGNAVRCLFEDSQRRLWVGTWDGGLNLFRKESGTFRSFVRSPTHPDSLSDNSVNVIFEDSFQRLWVGTSGGGVSIFVPAENRFRTISTRNGLSGDNIYGILEDKERNIWIYTGKGLSRITPIEENIQNFSRADGLLSNDFSQNAFLKTSDGTLFWGGPDGVSAFDPATLPREGTPSEVVITGLSVHNLPVRIGEEVDGFVILDRDISLKDRLILPHTANSLTVRFSILSYVDPAKHHYAVLLDGLEEHPHFLGNHNEVSYASLPPGEYTLNIFGTDHSGQDISRTRQLQIKILAPFWMHLWFRISLALIFLCLTGWIVWLRIRILNRNNEQLRSFSMHMEKAREEERKAAAREYHDELGQQLTALKFDLFWLNSHPEAEDPVRKEKIATLLDLVNDSIKSVRSLSTNLRPKALDNLSLKEALEWQSRRFTKRTAIPLGLDIQMTSPLEEDPEGEFKTAVFRMYQEILTNIIRHSGADRVEVIVGRDDDFFRLMVRDNGRGIDKNDTKKNDSFGLIGMRERCKHLKGRFLIDNHPEGGTVVRIILPLKEK